MFAQILVTVLNFLRAAYSGRFYQEIDWHCYMLFGEAIYNGGRKYVEFLCDYGYNVYPAAMSWLFAFLYKVTNGEVDIIIGIHCVLWTATAFLAFVTYPKSKSGTLLYVLLPLIVESPFRAGISRVTNDLWVAFFTGLLHFVVLRRAFWVATVVFAVLLSLKMNSLIMGPAVLAIYVNELSFATCDHSLSVFHLLNPL